MDRVAALAGLAIAVYLILNWSSTLKGSMGIALLILCMGLLLADAWMTLLGVLSPAGARGDLEGLADELESFGRSLYGGPHEYRTVGDDEYDAFMARRRQWVAEVESDLRLIGFSRLMTIEDMTARAAMPQIRALIRVFRYDRDRATTAGFYSPRVTGVFRLLQLIRVIPTNLEEIAFESELSNGRFLLTSTATVASKTEEVPGIERQFADPRTSISQLFETHQRRLRAELAADRTLAAVRIDTVEDAIASQHRQEQLKTAHRAGKGYITADDVRRLDEPGCDELAEVMRQRQAWREAAQRTANRQPGNQHDPSRAP